MYHNQLSNSTLGLSSYVFSRILIFHFNCSDKTIFALQCGYHDSKLVLEVESSVGLEDQDHLTNSNTSVRIEPLGLFQEFLDEANELFLEPRFENLIIAWTIDLNVLVRTESLWSTDSTLQPAISHVRCITGHQVTLQQETIARTKMRPSTIMTLDDDH